METFTFDDETFEAAVRASYVEETGPSVPVPQSEPEKIAKMSFLPKELSGPSAMSFQSVDCEELRLEDCARLVVELEDYENDSNEEETGNNTTCDIEDVMDDIGVGAYQWLVMLTCGLANAVDAIEIMSLSYVFPVIEENLPAWVKGAMSSAVFAGMLTGALVCGGLTDSFGRRPVLIGTMAMNGFFMACFAAASSHESMILLRFLTGFGCGGSVPVVFALPAEFVPAAYRGSAIAVVAAFWMVGSIIVAVLAWAIIPGMLQATNGALLHSRVPLLRSNFREFLRSRAFLQATAGAHLHFHVRSRPFCAPALSTSWCTRALASS